MASSRARIAIPAGTIAITSIAITITFRAGRRPTCLLAGATKGCLPAPATRVAGHAGRVGHAYGPGRLVR